MYIVCIFLGGIKKKLRPVPPPPAEEEIELVSTGFTARDIESKPGNMFSLVGLWLAGCEEMPRRGSIYLVADCQCFDYSQWKMKWCASRGLLPLLCLLVWNQNSNLLRIQV